MITVLVVANFLFGYKTTTGQNTRTNEYNNIGWYTTFATLKVAPRLSIHAEYQWRRNNYITHWQQSLLRTGINYQLAANATLRVGYGWIETYPYGNTPLNIFGKTFTEHRTFEALLIDNTVGRVQLNHRYMLEQRWVSKYSSPTINKADGNTYLHRLRYMVRAQLPLKGPTLDDKEPYIAVYDELFIGFGKNVGENIFDQNRVGLLAGYKFNNTLRIEGGYLNQIVQLGREVNGRNVLQYNNGFIISVYWVGVLKRPVN